MQDPVVTTQLILDTIQGYVESKTPIAPTTFLDAAIKLVALMSGETDKLIELHHDVAKVKVEMFDQEMTGTEAKARIEALDVFVLLKRQEAKVKKIESFVLLAKKYATILTNEARLN